MEVVIRHGRENLMKESLLVLGSSSTATETERRWLWRLESDMAGRGGGYGGWDQTWHVQEVLIEVGI
jgi:hypothetical protein